MKKNNFILTAIFFLLIPLMGAASITRESFTLDNGLKVIVINNKKTPAVSHFVWYKVGSKDDPLGKSGLAHFLEHMMFKGTKKFPKGKFSETVNKNGGEFNAFTDNDYTAYYENIGVEKLPLVMELEADRMTNISLIEDEVNKERAVVLEERSVRVDNEPLSLLHEQMMRSLYLNHPYGIPVIGWRHEIETFNSIDVDNFFQAYYTPDNAILVLSGDITANEVKPLVQKYYGNIPKRNLNPKVITQEPKQIAARRVKYVDKRSTSSYISRYYLAPSFDNKNTEEVLAINMIASALGDDQTGILYNELIVKKNLAVKIDVIYDELSTSTSHLEINIMAKDQNSLNLIETSLDVILKDIITHGINDVDLVRVKNNLKAQYVYSKESYQSLALIYGKLAVLDKEFSYYENWEKNIDLVNKTMIKNTAKKLFDINHSVTGTLIPKD